MAKKIKKMADGGDLLKENQMTPFEMEQSRIRGDDAYRKADLADLMATSRAAPARAATRPAPPPPMNPRTVRAPQMMRGLRGGMKKGGNVKKYAEGGNVDYSANEVSRMKPATPENTKRLQDRARKAGASEAAIAKATKGYARGGGIESKGKTRGRFV